MKKLVLLIILFISFQQTRAQFDNSWIRYNQEYYKVKVWQDGVCRINRQTLAFAGLNTASVDPRKIQLFKDGVEQYIYIQGENDGVFDNGDYLEFYGKHNDGSLDSRMYADTSWQPNVGYSLFTDTSVYFLTYNTSTLGKRLNVISDTTYSSHSSANYFIKNSLIDSKNLSGFTYNRGISDQSIDYRESEGWGVKFGYLGGSNQPLTIAVPTANVYSSGPNIQIQTTVGGVNNLQHNFQLSGPGLNYQDIYYAQMLKKYNFSLSPGLLTTNSTNYTFTISTVGPNPDNNMFYWMSLAYPHTFDLEGSSSFRMYVPDDITDTKVKINVSNFNAANVAPVFYDLTNHLRIVMTQNGSNWLALIPNDNRTNPKECFISADFAVTNPSVSKINYFVNNPGYFNNFQLVAVDSAFIILSNKTLWNQAQLYKAYRNTTTNGKAILIDVEELYDQFAYGIQKHPLAIKNFAHYILNTWTNVAAPAHLFLLGKSISPSDFRLNTYLFSQCLVASYGVPTSDMLLTSGIDGSIWEPKIPIGRLSATSGTNVTDYLTKVQEYEQVQAGPPQAWEKEILHFSGGDDASQQETLYSYLEDFRTILEDSSYGGRVTTYRKTSTDPIIINQSDSLQRQINSGVSLMTFFGHASGSGFDQSTDLPSNYGNQGKYPLMIANSCFAGDIHTSQKSVSESFVLEPEKAAIGFIASVGLGIPNYLYDYSKAFFTAASYTHYGATIGQLMRQAIIDNQLNLDEGHKIVCNEMSLQGDPSLRLNHFAKPDYAITESGIKLPGSTISTQQDTFPLTVEIRNYAKAVADSFHVSIHRIFPDGTDSTFKFKIGNCYYQSDIHIAVPVGGFNAAGINKIKVEIDLPDSVDEYDNLTNNTATADFFIVSNDIIPVYPSKFAIHPFNSVTLKACTSNPLAGIRSYVFQIDTIDLNVKDHTPGMQTSPLFRFTTVTDSGGVITWAPPGYTLQDSVVYFWRVANDSIQYDTVNYTWQQSSFQYIPGKTGWAQSQFFQFKEDQYTSVAFDTTNRKFNFINNLKELTVTNNGNPTSISETNQIGYNLNNASIEYDGCGGTPAIMVAVLDSITLDPWTNCQYNFGQTNTFTLTGGTCGQNPTGSSICRARPENYFIYRYQTAGQMTSLQSMLSQVPNGDYVLLYSWFVYNYSSADPAFAAALTSLGFNTGQLNDNAPFILFIKKGDLTSKMATIGVAQTDRISMTKLLSSIWNRGTITTETIGPSTRWESLHWNQHPAEPIATTRDTIRLTLSGLNSISNTWDILAPTILYQTGKDTTLAWVNAATYPYLKLSAYMRDDSLRTPPQMDYCRIYYDDVPECAINPNNVFTFHANPLQEGDSIRMSVAIDNIGNLPMDSLLVKFYLYDNNRAKHNLQSVRLDSLRTNRSLTATIRIDSTFGLAGNTSLWIEANPLDSLHQLEKYHFNNLAEIKFKINRDLVNPILDVTFDGIHILNSDIISGKPQITVQLHDENKFLALNDTTKFKVYLRAPGTQIAQQIQFSSPSFGQVMRFTPAQLPKNSCRIDWNPEFTDDGTYTLEVEAADRTGNESGRYNYKIQFEVVNKSSITEVLNYPNPFSTSTRFVFTLTGNQIPTHMKIQIMTITGKIIREIMQNELGNIHIGRNITEYAWDGKDEFGDQLANGLYLYRVITDINGEKIDKRETDADKYFKKGWGKMYLIR